MGLTGLRARAVVLAAVACGACALLGVPSGASAAKLLKVTWMKGATAPNTPKSLDKVGVIKIGNKKAKNVLVIEPGTSGGGAYFAPLAKWLNELAPEWQVWAVERRENLLEEQKVADKYKEGKISGKEFFDWYLGWLEGGITKHYKRVTPSEAEKDGATEWGMAVAVEDLHVVIEAAKKLGGKVVLAGHSLGRLGRDRLRDLGLRRQARRRRALRAGLHRRRLEPHPDQHRRSRSRAERGRKRTPG